MELINPFDVFSVTELSEAINIIPNMYGRVGELGLFEVKGLTTDMVAVEEKNGSLAMLPAVPRGSPGDVGKVGKRKVRTFKCPQMLEIEGIEGDEVNRLRGFGVQGQMALETLVADKLTTARGKHDISLEFMRMGALKGILIDGGGTTLFNYYTEFGITQKVIDFNFTSGTLDVRAQCMAVVRWMEDNLLGDVMNGVRALVSPEWFDALVGHANVKAAFANYVDAAQRLGGDMRKGFTFGGITFEEYRGNATDASGNNQKFIAANEGHAFPMGTRQSFRTFVAPADFNETVGQMGQLYYAKIEPRKFNRGYDALTQSNPLPMCMRPGILVKLTKS
jgi:hypothetical protein